MRKYIIGALFGFGISLVTVAFASDSIQALIFPANIVINGQEKVVGDEYSILNVNGHAYVPIRYVAEQTSTNVDYDAQSQTIYLAYGKMDVQDPAKSSIKVGNLILTSNSDTTRVAGQLQLEGSETCYVQATLEFYNQQQARLGSVSFENDFKPGMNMFETRNSGLFANYSTVKITVHDIHHGVKQVVEDLYKSAKEQDESSIKRLLTTVRTEDTGYVLLEFMKQAVPYNHEVYEYLLPFILEIKPDINIRDQATGNSPLIYASSYARGLIEPLVTAGADVTVTAKDGTTALEQIVSWQQPELVKLLLDHGADPNAGKRKDLSPLLAALNPTFRLFTANTVATVRYLLEAGARVEGVDWNGRTPMQNAEQIDDPEIKDQIVRLLKAYSNPTTK